MANPMVEDFIAHVDLGVSSAASLTSRHHLIRILDFGYFDYLSSVCRRLEVQDTRNSFLKIRRQFVYI
jgi:hypothetical protein